MLRHTATVMGMPAVLQIAHSGAGKADAKAVVDYWRTVDRQFSPFKKTSELSRFNRGEVSSAELSVEMREVLRLSEQTSVETDGYFNIQRPDHQLDPSGLVKGWAIFQGAKMLKEKGYRNFYVEIAGDIQTSGVNDRLESWRIGIRNPFDLDKLAAVLSLSGQGVATSGSYLQGAHIYNPHHRSQSSTITSLTVVGPNVYEADRFATAAFAMGLAGLDFIENQPELEGFMITADSHTLATSGFSKYVVQPTSSRQ